MLILLPPSEGKADRRRGAPVRPASLSFPALGEQRQRVAAALAEVSDRADAAAVLGVSPALADDIARNTRLSTAPALRADELYTGVLYDALDLGSLDAAARRRAARWIVIVSALHGALRVGDRVAPYRLSMGVNLPGIGPLAAAWRPVLDEALPAEAGRSGLLVDCRSSTYVAAWQPRDALAERWVEVTVPGASHMAKHTRGLVARAICAGGLNAARPAGLAEELSATGRFDVAITEPARTGRPWRLAVTARHPQGG